MPGFAEGGATTDRCVGATASQPNGIVNSKQSTGVRVGPVYRSPFTVRSRLIPAYRLLVQIDEDLLGLQVFFDSPVAQLAPETRGLVAAPGGLHKRRLHVIHPHNTGFE